MPETNYILSKKPTGSIVSDTILPASLTGLRGPKGDLGPGNTLSVGNTTTGLPGTAAFASLSGISPNQQLFFTIPSGVSPTLSVNSSVPTVPSGSQGSASLGGPDALHPALYLTLPAGATGPANTLDVLSTTTGTPGTPANVTISGSSPNQHLRFTIPAGQNGSDASVTSANITAALGYTPIGDAPDTLYQYARTKGSWQTISGGGGNPFDQSLNTNDAVTFGNVTSNFYSDVGYYGYGSARLGGAIISKSILGVGDWDSTLVTILNPDGSASFANGAAGFDASGNITAFNLGSMSSQNDAPSDGNQYARKNAGWVTVSGGAGNVLSVNGQTGTVVLTTDNVSEGATNKYSTASRILATVLTGFSTATNAVVVATDSLLTALGKLQAQISVRVASDGTVTSIIRLTQTAYNALPVKDPNTLYLIVG